jgi:hypothetical protein
VYWTNAERDVDREHSEAEELTEKAKTAREKATQARAAATTAFQALQTAVGGDDPSLPVAAAEEAHAAARHARDAETDAEAAEAEASEAERRASEEPEARRQILAVRRFNRTGEIAMSALLWAAVWLPAFLIAAASVPLAEARACLTGRPLLGEFIGETKERMYVTDALGDRIVSLPIRELDRTYIGDEARGDGSADATCP